MDNIKIEDHINDSDNNLLWKLDNEFIYNKYTQYIYNDDVNNDNVKSNDDVNNDNVKSNDVNNDNVKSNDVNNDNAKSNDVNNDNAKSNNANSDNVKSDNMKSDNVKSDNDNKFKNKIKKNIIKLPLEVFIEETNSNEIIKPYIKEKLIEKISEIEYTKVFGQKKSSEIVKGLVENKWNKSLILFISFLLDKKILYENKEIVYNKELMNIETIIL